MTKKMPVMFIGHGSPINAVNTNTYTKTLENLAAKIEKPEIILCVSAHWMTRGSFVTAMDNPKTIHDFGGFPKNLYEVEYPAMGSPSLAEEIKNEIPEVGLNYDWGLDHGTWSVLRHLYQDASIPVIQLSLDMTKPPEEHFKLGEKLAYLREKKVLILGSGNIVHNLRIFSWEENAEILGWAKTYDDWSKEKLRSKDFNSLIYHFRDSEEGKLAVPSLDHYLPLLYVLGASTENDRLEFVFEGIQNASISMTSFLLTE